MLGGPCLSASACRDPDRLTSKRAGTSSFRPLQQRRDRVTARSGIIDPMPAWLPGSPRRDTSCRYRSLAVGSARPVRQMPVQDDEAQVLPGPHVEIDRSLRTPHSHLCPLPVLLPSGPKIMVRPTRSLVVTTSDIGAAPEECNVIKTKSHVARFGGILRFAPCKATCS
jgi:hypothetical protein